MAATKADLDQLDSILDRLDDHTKSSLDPTLDRISDDLTAWYKRMFRPTPCATITVARPATTDRELIQRVLDAMEDLRSSPGTEGIWYRISDEVGTARDAAEELMRRQGDPKPPGDARAEGRS